MVVVELDETAGTAIVLVGVAGGVFDDVVDILFPAGWEKQEPEGLGDGHTFFASVVRVVYFSRMPGMSSGFGTLNRVMRLMFFAMVVV